MEDRGDLSRLLTTWRARLRPAMVGLPAVSSRIPGLRREEVSMLAGVSVDYLVRLEQGRARRPSIQVARSLARALQLSVGERDQLFRAAELPIPLPSEMPTHIPPSVQRLLLRAPEIAIGVYTIDWSLLSVNPSWQALLGQPPKDHNLIEAHFTGTAPEVLMSRAYIERFERALVTDMRNAALRYPNDETVQHRLRRLRAIAHFEEIWREGSSVEQQSEPKTFNHPVVGPITVDCDVYTAVGTDLRVITYTAEPGSEDASKYDLVRALGVHNPAAV
ncbi:transcriptional regulator [Curtobacterium sp. MCPF17_047]|uniref:helix-turn-helix transcriptional regulator n=1 Tax=Curtobacterium sp. MCPF17_047 TaxID=2175654 RepID=UPI000DA9BC7D|nr:helix-turn-helix transcriptional regulator [Curtobacterium sp. MCPF17_047]PZF68955.1 transcriptional regulator [Curtobacterium sp. MCPF17_047]